MYIIKIFICYLAIASVVDEARGLVKLLTLRDSIKKAEAVIRTTSNRLFFALKIKGLKDNPRIKQYSQIHNNFISLTLRDHSTIKKIVKITRVDKSAIDNNTANFIELINEILNADSNEPDQNENSTVVAKVTQNLVNFVDESLQRLIRYQNGSSLDDIDKDISKPNVNTTTQEEEDLAVWRDTLSDEEVIQFDNTTFWEPNNTSRNRRIYHGSQTKVRYFPFVASVQIFGHFQCGSSVIESDLVISAASCLQLAYNNRFYHENPKFLAVRVGSNFYTGGGEMIPVLEVYFHPAYNPKTLRNNLCIMRLSKKINLRNKVKRIEISKRVHPLPFETDGITIVGWGASKPSNIIDEPFVHRISYSIIDIFPYDDCRDIYSPEYISRTLNFCAGRVSIGSGACHRDVGGPGIVAGYLAGVISFGSPVCGTPNAPTVFTRLGPYVEWIDSIREQESLIPVKKERTTTLSPQTEGTTRATALSTTDADTHLMGQLQKEYFAREDKNLKVGFVEKFLKTMFKSNEVNDFMYFFNNEDYKDSEGIKQAKLNIQKIKKVQDQLLKENKTLDKNSIDYPSTKQKAMLTKKRTKRTKKMKKTKKPATETMPLVSHSSPSSKATSFMDDEDYTVLNVNPPENKLAHELNKRVVEDAKIEGNIMSNAINKSAAAIKLRTLNDSSSGESSESSGDSESGSSSESCSSSEEPTPTLRSVLTTTSKSASPYDINSDEYSDILPEVTSVNNNNKKVIDNNEDNVVIPKSLMYEFLTEMMIARQERAKKLETNLVSTNTTNK